VLLTRSPLINHRNGIIVRLACVKHAASVRPEPGSNSPSTNTTNHPHPKGTSSQQENPNPAKTNQTPHPTTGQSNELTSTNKQLASIFGTLLSSQTSPAQH
jgi:hypothetical protein